MAGSLPTRETELSSIPSPSCCLASAHLHHDDDTTAIDRDEKNSFKSDDNDGNNVVHNTNSNTPTVVDNKHERNKMNGEDDGQQKVLSEIDVKSSHDNIIETNTKKQPSNYASPSASTFPSSSNDDDANPRTTAIDRDETNSFKSDDNDGNNVIHNTNSKTPTVVDNKHERNKMNGEDDGQQRVLSEVDDVKSSHDNIIETNTKKKHPYISPSASTFPSSSNDDDDDDNPRPGLLLGGRPGFPSARSIHGIDGAGAHMSSIKQWIEDMEEESSSENHHHHHHHQNEKSTFVIPNNVIVTDELEHSLQLLSCYIEQCFYETMTQDDDDDDDDWRLIVKSVAKIPGLMKTIILIDDDDDRERILDYPIVKWVMMCKYSIMGDRRDNASLSLRKSWLVKLIKLGGSSSSFHRQQIMAYLEAISNMTSDDLLPGTIKLPQQQRQQPLDSSLLVKKHTTHFLSLQNDLFSTASQMPELLPSLLLLPTSSLEDVACTPIVSHVISSILSRPLGRGIIFLDLCAHLLTTSWVRGIVVVMNELIRGTYVREALTIKTIGVTTYATLGISFWAFRWICGGLSVLSLSVKVFRSDAISFWNVLDGTALSMAFYAYFVIARCLTDGTECDRGMLEDSLLACSVAVWMLWFSVLGVLKVLNQEFATIVLAVSRILRDTVAFIFLLLGVISVFADMLNLYLSAQRNVCPQNFRNSTHTTDSELPFCGNYWDSFLLVYGVFVGDFDSDSFRETTFTTVVYVLLTFFGIIILLNVIIALVCDSYATSQRRAHKLYGRARLSYAAAVIAFEDLVRPQPWRRDAAAADGRKCHASRKLGRAFLLLISLWPLFNFAMMIYLYFDLAADFQDDTTLLIWSSVFIGGTFLFFWAAFVSFLITGWEDKKEDNMRHKCLRIIQSNRITQMGISVIMYFASYVNRDKDDKGHNKEFTNGLLRCEDNKTSQADPLTLLKSSIDEGFSLIHQRLDNNETELKKLTQNFVTYQQIWDEKLKLTVDEEFKIRNNKKPTEEGKVDDSLKRELQMIIISEREKMVQEIIRLTGKKHEHNSKRDY